MPNHIDDSRRSNWFHIRYAVRALMLIALIVFAVPAWSQDAAEPDKTKQAATDETAAAKSDAEPEAKTTAQRIIDLERSIEESEAELAALKTETEDPASEFAEAKTEFAELDKQLKEKRAALEQAQEDGDGQRASAIETELEPLTKKWQLAKDRFDLAVEEQTAAKEKIATLEQRIETDREALARLESPKPTAQTGTDSAGTDAAAAPPRTDEATNNTAGAATPPAAEPNQATGQAAQPNGQPAPPGETAQSPDDGEEPSEELIEAQEEAKAKAAEAQAAEANVKSIDQRIELLRTQIAQEQKLLETARKKVSVAREQQRTLRAELEQRRNEGAPRAEIDDLWKQVSDAETRVTTASGNARQRQDTIDRLNKDLLELQDERIAALEEAQAKREAAESASKEVEKLQNPFSPQNLMQWGIDHGPRLLAIVIGAFLLLWFTRLFEKRLQRLLVWRSDRGSQAERQGRAETLTSVFRSAAIIVIVVGSILMILTEVGVRVGPLLGGAAVIGLAVAFGAQSLVKDYFYGFIILLENQYTIGDVIRINGTAGQVERITLRMTVLRDLEGIVHFIPHGEASQVSNMTHGWSRAVLDVGVSYNENADEVMDVLMQVGKELRDDPEFSPLIMDEPEILGLNEMADSAIVIRLMVKTQPLKQWAVKREYLRRIKARFDEVGIEIPYPHRTVYHRYENGQHPSALSGEGHVSELAEQSS